MAAARIAAVLLISIVPLVGAQEPPKTVLTVQVMDTTGAPIPGTQVDAGNEFEAPVGGEANGQGAISFALSPGTYNLTAAYPGFCPETKTVEVLKQAPQGATINMTVAGCPTKCMPVCIDVTPLHEPRRTRRHRLEISVTEARVVGFVAIAGARIEVDPSPLNPGRVLKTDSKGYASLDPAAGIHTVSITSPGFYRWTHQIDVPKTGSKTIVAELRVVRLIDVITPIVSLIDIPAGTPEPVFLSPEPLLTLHQLPSRPAKSH